MIKNIFGSTSLKVNWQGEIVAIQPRTRVWRYLTDNRTHYLIGYNLFIVGDGIEGEKQFSVAISEKQQLKDLFRIGDVLAGTAWTKIYAEREFADYYKAGSLKLLSRVSVNTEMISPPWMMIPPTMQIYEKIGAMSLVLQQAFSIASIFSLVIVLGFCLGTFSLRIFAS
ncbi:MAG: hypothetical protein H7Y18_19640 [Clostridiaceae bacterium]|nr:hypothetical protein [Clostridiaceae bacterium]